MLNNFLADEKETMNNRDVVLRKDAETKYVSKEDVSLEYRNTKENYTQTQKLTIELLRDNVKKMSWRI